MKGFNDGMIAVYAVENRAAPGEKPKDALFKRGTLRYQRRTVGIQRHYAAMNAGARVDLLLRVPYRRSVSTQDVAVPTLDGKQYRITLIQVPEDVNPPVMDLTLERLERDYDLSGQDTGCPAGCHR